MPARKRRAAADDSAASPARSARLRGDASFSLCRGVVNDRLRGVDLSLMDGEIHGLAGLIGSGRTEILETVFGLRPIDARRAPTWRRGSRMRGPAEAIEKGVALVPEDRQVQGLVLDHSIERNFSLPRLPHFSWASWVRRGAETEETEAAIARLSIKAPGAFNPRPQSFRRQPAKSGLRQMEQCAHAHPAARRADCRRRRRRARGNL